MKTELDSREVLASDTSTHLYGEDYIKWKNWEYGKSGLSKDYEIYCQAEIKRTELKEIRTVLEIGFGNGDFLTYCQKQKWHVVGTEANHTLIQLARKAGYEALSANELDSLQTTSFDLIVAFDVLEHIDQSQLSLFLSSIRRLLKDDGVFLARFPNGDSPFSLASQHGDITHVTTLGRGKVEYFAKNGGFEIIYCGGAAQPIFCGSLVGTLRRMLIVPVKRSLEILFRTLFFAKSRIDFISPNLVIALKKQKS